MSAALGERVDDKTMTRDEAAELLGVKPQSVWITMTRRGFQPVARQPSRGGQLLWRASDVQRLAAERK